MRHYSLWLPPVKAQSHFSFSPIFQGLLSHNHRNWKEGHLISSVPQTRRSQVPTSNQECLRSRVGLSNLCARSSPCVMRCLWGSRLCSHERCPRASSMLIHCFGNNNISVPIMSYFIKCWAAKVLKPLLCLCRTLNTLSAFNLFSTWGKSCPLNSLNALKLLLETTHEGAFTFQHFIIHWFTLFAKIIMLKN